MGNCKPRKTPIHANLSLSKDSGELVPQYLEQYQELDGCLLYLTGCTRPDLAKLAGVMSRFMSAPTDVHLSAVKQIIGYLAGTINQDLKYSKGSSKLIGYCDADYAGEVDK